MDTTNNRTMKRMRALKSARYLLPGYAGSGIDCMIVDLHSAGARIRFADPVLVREEQVEFIIFPENIRVTGKRAWHRGREMGVQFDQPLAWLQKHDKSLKATA